MTQNKQIMSIRDLKQWLCWRWDERDGKPTKVPYSPLSGEKARTNDPDTWASFREAAHRRGNYDGIGFVFTEEDDFVGVDLDGCRDRESGAVERWALEIVDELDSYTEISPSGTGLHILLMGNWPEGRNRKGQIEVYDRGRFFTMTGRHLEGTPRTIESRQEQLLALGARVFGEAATSPNGHKMPRPESSNGLTDQEILQKAASSRSGEKFRRLLAGDTSDYSSASEADQAYCSLLAFWTGPDPARIDDLFRQSGLYREKWERPDYRERTIKKALEGKAEFYEPKAQAKLKRSGLRDNAYNALFGEVPHAPPFPVEALPPACRRFAEEAARAIGCPVDLVAVPMLALLAAGVGNSRVVELKRGWTESATLFLAVVQPPGGKKTPAAKAALSPVWKRQVDLKREYREEREAYEEEHRRWEAERKEATRSGKEAPPPPREPVMVRTVVEDVTVEALAVVLDANPRGVLVYRDELTAWINSMDMYKGGRGSDRQVWLSLWSNSPMSVDRKGKPEPMIIERPWVSVVGSIQPKVLSEISNDREDGLLDRFLFAYPEPFHAPLSDDEISAAAEYGVKNLYDGLSELTMPESNGEPFPGRVGLAPESWKLFKEFSDSLTTEACELGFPRELAGAWSKLEACLARLALILCLSRVVENGAPERVEPEDMLNAWKIVGYFKPHTKRVYARVRGESPQDLFAAELEAFLSERGGEWEGEPAELREAFEKRESEAVPAQPAELSKMVFEVAGHSPSLKAQRGWGKKEGRSRRILRLTLERPVDRVVPVNPGAGKGNGVYGDTRNNPEVRTVSGNENEPLDAQLEDFVRMGSEVGSNAEEDPGVDF